MGNQRKRIVIEIKDKVAMQIGNEKLVCGNNDYDVEFIFDEAWSDYSYKTALFVFGSDTVEVPFSGNVVEGVAIEKATRCEIGAFAGDIITTTKASIVCVPSIRDIANTPKPPREDVYNRIMKLLNGLQLGSSAIVDVEELPTNEDEIHSNILYRTIDGVFYFDGEWRRVADEGDIASVEAELKTKQDTIAFDGKYDAETNKAATVETVIRKVAEIVAGAPDDFNTLKELSDWLITHGGEAAEMNSAIKQNSDDIAEINEGLTDYVKNTDVVTKDGGNYGLVKLKPFAQGGFTLSANGELALQPPNDTLIWYRVSTHAITPSELDKSVKYALTGHIIRREGGADIHHYENKLALTNEEKGYAHKWLGLPYMSNEVEAEYSWANTSYTINNSHNIFSGFSGVTSVNVGLATTDILSLDDIGACEIFGGDTSYGYLSEASIISLIGAYYFQTNDGAVVLVVTNRVKFNNAYNQTLPSNGTYLCTMTYDRQRPDSTMYSYSITVSKLRKYQLTKCDNKFLDLENNAVIKALMARIEALENK